MWQSPEIICAVRSDFKARHCSFTYGNTDTLSKKQPCSFPFTPSVCERAEPAIPCRYTRSGTDTLQNQDNANVESNLLKQVSASIIKKSSETNSKLNKLLCDIHTPDEGLDDLGSISAGKEFISSQPPPPPSKPATVRVLSTEGINWPHNEVTSVVKMCHVQNHRVDDIWQDEYALKCCRANCKFILNESWENKLLRRENHSCLSG
jgi:hypothetical protein